MQGARPIYTAFTHEDLSLAGSTKVESVTGTAPVQKHLLNLQLEDYSCGLQPGRNQQAYFISFHFISLF